LQYKIGFAELTSFAHTELAVGWTRHAVARGGVETGRTGVHTDVLMQFQVLSTANTTSLVTRHTPRPARHTRVLFLVGVTGTYVYTGVLVGEIAFLALEALVGVA
jgi:hypothetical protein